ncbi:MAG: SRPBCC family protein [Candidatus Tectomicrobia bacterium]|uniref:SRPBCC family protein n=1 Tax=Tectimicrobiota bacterium TaxID=2528274 RepID=A0A932M282_UNCTE|nr:SRPBCC family protein [Candidatus Tectomicrobia bacterium]
MEPVIIRIAESVEIAAPPSAVFALVSDPLAKARLNPFVQVIRIEREDPGPLCEGRITFLRLQKGTRIFEYRTRCRALEPDRLLENQAELPTLFRVRVELEPIPGGTRLTQREECEVRVEMLEGLPVPRRAERAWQTIKILGLVLPVLARETYALILKERTDTLRETMGRELQVWLQAIKQHLESPGRGVSTPQPEAAGEQT